MKQFLTKAYLKRLAKGVREAEHRVMLAKLDLESKLRFWRQEMDEYYKEQREIRARRKVKA